MDAVTLSLSPLIPPVLAYGLGALALAVAGFALVRGLKGWLWRALAALVLTGALLNPALVQETREPLSDVAVLITDDSASMQIGTRSDAAAQVAQAVRALAERDPLLDLIEVSGGASEDGTRLSRALQQGLSQAPRNRLAGVIIASDGQVHDTAPSAEELGLDAPVHHFLTGDPEARDRRLIVSQAPRYGLVGDPVSFTLRVEDEGAATGAAIVNLYVDGAIRSARACRSAGGDGAGRDRQSRAQCGRDRGRARPRRAVPDQQSRGGERHRRARPLAGAAGDGRAA
jgi:hypothetical protein